MLVDRLRTITVTATSPDKTVKATITTTDGMSVRIRPGSLAGHNVRSLSTQLSAVLAGAGENYRLACGTVVDESRKARGLPEKPSPDGPVGKFAAAMRALDAIGTSPNGMFAVRRRGDGSFDVRIREHDLAYLDEAAVAAEINAAIAAASSAYSRQTSALFEQAFPDGRPLKG